MEPLVSLEARWDGNCVLTFRGPFERIIEIENGELEALRDLLDPNKDRRPVDPPDCGCTECLTGEYRTARDWDDYFEHNPQETDWRP